MISYITTSRECDKHYIEEFISRNGKKTDDELLILCAEDDMFSVDIINALTSSNKKIEFIKLGSLTDKESFQFTSLAAFNIGKLSEHKEECLIVSEDVNLQILSSLLSKGESGKKKRKPREVSKKISSEEKVADFAQLPAYIEEKSQEVSSKEIIPSKTEKKKLDKDDDFEKVYAELEALCESVKTKEYNPISNIGSIVKAGKSAIKNKTGFLEEISLWVQPATFANIQNAFEGKESALLNIISRLHDEIE